MIRKMRKNKIIVLTLIVGCLLFARCNRINNNEGQNLQSKLDSVCTFAKSKANEGFLKGFIGLEIPHLKPELKSYYELILLNNYGFKDAFVTSPSPIIFCGNTSEEGRKLYSHQDACFQKAFDSLFVCKFGKDIYSI